MPSPTGSSCSYTSERIFYVGPIHTSAPSAVACSNGGAATCSLAQTATLLPDNPTLSLGTLHRLRAADH